MVFRSFLRSKFPYGAYCFTTKEGQKSFQGGVYKNICMGYEDTIMLLSIWFSKKWKEDQVG